jgi:hypothetical protein
MLSFCINPAKLPAQNTITQEPPCLSIHVRLNGKPVGGPPDVILRPKDSDNIPSAIISAERGCFGVPPVLFLLKEVDVFFTVAGNKIHLAAIRTGFLAGSWDVTLEDKKFGRGVDLPKGTFAREACVVVFHVGEPETQIVQTRCRRAVPQ